MLGLLDWLPYGSAPPDRDPISTAGAEDHSEIATESGRLLPTMACALALLEPTRIGTSGDTVVFTNAKTGNLVSVVWPAGRRAWRVDGQAVLVGRDGTVTGREGDVLPRATPAA